VSLSQQFGHGRHAGVLLPLFSAPSRRSWGIGEIGDLPMLASWLESAGFDFLQVLPLNEMASGQHSPYSAVSAMALDPIYLSPEDLPELASRGGEAILEERARRRLAAVRAAGRVAYNEVRDLKDQALRAAFEWFVAEHWTPGTSRADALRAFTARECWWLDDYVLFRALRQVHHGRPWWEWDAGLAARDASALREARRSLAEECLFHAYTQWVADGQWQAARAAAAPVGVFGDFPFMVGADSADVWAYQHAFRRDASVGAPPDAFSATGQDWGLPVYRWDVFEAENDAWLRARARRSAALFDGFRVDHLVGFYRTYSITADGRERRFLPARESDQLQQGERLMRVFLESGARIIAEDLGTVPDFVRESLARLGIPGYRVLRWERGWDDPDQPFIDPGSYPAMSVATTGTHDTETLVEWWESATEAERTLVARLPSLQGRGIDPASPQCDPATQAALLEALIASASDLIILPMQDLFGWRERVNVPATVGDDNWTWRLPWPVDEMCGRLDVQARARQLLEWMQAHGRVQRLTPAAAHRP
jgi:4-alpha-glucanotransferase